MSACTAPHASDIMLHRISRPGGSCAEDQGGTSFLLDLGSGHAESHGDLLQATHSVTVHDAWLRCGRIRWSHSCIAAGEMGYAH